ncbi:dihydroorotase [Tyzzerella sp. OttesenSCG-928-J15]|nr:dihydroorotase [Tyzzerella sp. OttesenSCG-928-J15]
MIVAIKNGIVIDPDGNERNLDIVVQNETIVEVGENLDTGNMPVIDAGGAYVLPGFIDTNCEICDPGYENIEDLSTATKSAAKGGFTSITGQPTTSPVVDNKTVVSYITGRSKKMSIVNVYVYGSLTMGCEGKHMAEIGEMVNAGVVAVSDGGKCVGDAALMRNIMRYSSMFNIPVITACEDASLSASGVVNEGKVATAYGLIGIPRAAEEIIVSRNIILSENTGCKLHISSVSTKGSVNLIREAKKKGINITCETQPHYFTLTEKSVEGYNTLAKVKPPLRTDEDVEAVIEGLCDGTIDVISSGHRPATIEGKNKEFDMASFGISSLETAFAVSYNALVATGKMTMGKLVEKMNTSPAKLLNLDNKCGLKAGNDADIVIFSGDEEYYINPANFASKAKFSPFGGTTVKGRVKYTIVAGEMVYIDDINY